MAKSKSKLKAKGKTARRIALGNRLRFGRLEARGVPAILLGAATIVLAAGVSATLRKSATLLPETLREAREFWLALRESRRILPS
ncbi:MAG: hypothetical protein IAI50_18300 [Candidatus Eremiobacteraeota bacterium]|nr:hypothetical protein [Candidatus Eremiobacteraeota bacterium]